MRSEPNSYFTNRICRYTSCALSVVFQPCVRLGTDITGTHPTSEASTPPNQLVNSSTGVLTWLPPLV